MLPMGSRSQNLATNLFLAIHHAIITSNIHSAHCLKPFPLIPHWTPNSIMENKIYGINYYEALENKKNKTKSSCDVFFASMPIELHDHLITCQH